MGEKKTMCSLVDEMDSTFDKILSSFDRIQNLRRRISVTKDITENRQKMVEKKTMCSLIDEMDSTFDKILSSFDIIKNLERRISITMIYSDCLSEMIKIDVADLKQDFDNIMKKIDYAHASNISAEKDTAGKTDDTESNESNVDVVVCGENSIFGEQVEIIKCCHLQPSALALECAVTKTKPKKKCKIVRFFSSLLCCLKPKSAD